MVEEPNKQEVTIRDLYPDYSEEELKEAEAEWMEYLEVVMKIYQRILNDPIEYQRFRELMDKNKEDNVPL